MATMTMNVSNDYSMLFRAGLVGLSQRTNVFDPSEDEITDAKHNRLSMLTKLTGFNLPPLPPHASRSSSRSSSHAPHTLLPTIKTPKRSNSGSSTTRRRHVPRLSLDTRFSRVSIRAEDSFLSFSATADTYAIPSSGVAGPYTIAARRRRTPGLVSRFSPDSALDEEWDSPDLLAPPGSPTSALWTPASAETSGLSPLSPALRAPPPTPAPAWKDARSPVTRAPPCSPASPAPTSTFARRSYVAGRDLRSPLSPLVSPPPSAVRFSDVWYLWDASGRRMEGCHPYGVDWEDAVESETHPYAAA